MFNITYVHTHYIFLNNDVSPSEYNVVVVHVPDTQIHIVWLISKYQPL